MVIRVRLFLLCSGAALVLCMSAPSSTAPPAGAPLGQFQEERLKAASQLVKLVEARVAQGEPLRPDFIAGTWQPAHRMLYEARMDLGRAPLDRLAAAEQYLAACERARDTVKARRGIDADALALSFAECWVAEARVLVAKAKPQ